MKLYPMYCKVCGRQMAGRVSYPDSMPDDECMANAHNYLCPRCDTPQKHQNDKPYELKLHENHYLGTSRSICILAGISVPDGIYPKMTDDEYMQAIMMAAQIDFVTANMLAQTLSYHFGQVKFKRLEYGMDLGNAWEDIQYHNDI